MYQYDEPDEDKDVVAYKDALGFFINKITSSPLFKNVQVKHNESKVYFYFGGFRFSIKFSVEKG